MLPSKGKKEEMKPDNPVARLKLLLVSSLLVLNLLSKLRQTTLFPIVDRIFPHPPCSQPLRSPFATPFQYPCHQRQKSRFHRSGYQIHLGRAC